MSDGIAKDGDCVGICRHQSGVPIEIFPGEWECPEKIDSSIDTNKSANGGH